MPIIIACLLELLLFIYLLEYMLVFFFGKDFSYSMILKLAASKCFPYHDQHLEDQNVIYHRIPTKSFFHCT